MARDEESELLGISTKELDNIEEILTRVKQSLDYKIDQGWSGDETPSFVRDDLYSILMNMNSKAINIQYHTGHTQQYTLDKLNIRETEELYNWLNDCKEFDEAQDSNKVKYKDPLSEELFLQCQDCNYIDRGSTRLRTLFNYDKPSTCPKHGNNMELVIRIERTSQRRNARIAYGKLKRLVDSYIKQGQFDADLAMEKRFTKSEISLVYYDIKDSSYFTLEFTSGSKEEYDITLLGRMELQELRDWLDSKISEIDSAN
ncbi:hypothetical protein MYX76_06180 [Desulfobacterota bacterium AH_259_B03_O07]|nr:hypothetical protein [Desulfobacterota bacterium AH_259_B03_O07]